MQNLLKKSLKFLNVTPKNFAWFTFFIVLLTFVLSYGLIYINNPFFNGDFGVIALITDDLSHGKLYSWYFYGQTYYGNLENFVLVPLTFISGLTIKTLYFWEHSFYFFAVLFLLINMKKLRIWQIILYSNILFFAVRFYHFTYYPQGFAFVLLIIVFFLIMYDKLYHNKISNVSGLSFLTGIFSSLALWHYPVYIIIAPIFWILLIYKKYFINDLNFTYKDVCYFCIGLVLGSVPFVMGVLETDFENLKHFTSSDEGLVVKVFNSILYYTKDYFYYFLNTDNLSDGVSVKGIFTNLLQVRNIWGITLLASFSALFIYSLKNLKKDLVVYLFIFFLLVILLFRGIPSQNDYLFGVIRYAIPVYVLMYYVVLKQITSILNTVTGGIKKNMVLISLSVYTIISLFIFVPANILSRLVHRYNGPQSYEKVLEKILKEEVYYVYCDDFYQMCNALAFLGNDKGVSVQLINTPESIQERNPDDIGKVDLAVEKGERVFSLIKKTRLSEGDSVLDIYDDGKYYLVEGVYQQYQK